MARVWAARALSRVLTRRTLPLSKPFRANFSSDSDWTLGDPLPENFPTIVPVVPLQSRPLAPDLGVPIDVTYDTAAAEILEEHSTVA
eukprot:CAMPEP_0117072846 /NCGR_PEP_ID=MMETSP0472-20121206/51285_1 /TAXON_ID=693140 ORGANISM="Tiarina fusus, Strain LIS" /NCGR_SAMPLE_ID=MMETSP0472 /ASSEMBLY_ACC=CAM_ASM_000603 /LENGTH=86 /DNA_ID=CAMNT_0004797141 /DNA_START=8 /DNA_END=264 /DNA_ORIENTATION=+